MFDRNSAWYRSVSVQLVLLILVCTLIPLGVTTYVAIGESQAALESTTSERLEADTGAVAQNAEDRSEIFATQLEQVRDHPAIEELIELRYENHEIESRVDEFEEGTAYPKLLSGEPEYETAVEHFHTVAERNEHIDMVRVFWEDGNVLAGHTLGEETREDYRGDKLWFHQTMNEEATGVDEVYISNINIARSTDSPAIRYVMPIEHDGERVGLVIINYQAVQITEAAETLEIGENGYGMMVAPNYVTAEGDELGAAFISHGDDPGLAFDEASAGDIYLPEDELVGQEGTFEYDYDGQSWHAEYERVVIGGEEYYAIATVPTDQMLAAATAIRNLGGAVAGGSALVVFLVGFVATRRLTNPLQRLTDDAAAVADGKYDREIHRSSVNTEIDDLSRAIGQMKENVVEALDEAEAQQKAAERQRQESEALTADLERQAAEFGDLLDRAADGDLTVRLDTTADNEAMEAIADSCNEMLSELESTVVGLQTFADEVATTSQQVTTSTGDVSEASTDVSTSIQQIADGADDQSQKLQDVAGEMQQLSAMVEEVASQATTVAETAEKTTAVGAEGREAATDAIDDMETIERLAGEAVEAVETLDDRFEAITEITDLIADIAEQTNILALNANIEAARSETDGNGFAVVANEVKALANETKDSAEEIESIVEETDEQIELAVKNVQQAQERIHQGTETVEQAVGAFDEMVDNVEETNDGVQEISDATDDQADSTQEVVTMADDVASIAEEMTAESESVSAASEEQTSSLEEVLGSTRTLSQQAEDLQQRLDTFSVDASSGRDTPEDDTPGKAISADD